MKTATGMLLLVLLVSPVVSQQSTIKLDDYRNAKKYSFAEASYTVGKHTYTIVNIKPLFETDTACISAVVIDKRKLVLHDIGPAGKPTGLIVPSAQPIANGVVVLKPSQYESKTFLLLPNGKVVTLPGANLAIDTVGSCVYAVWDNDGTFRLTVFDYQRMRMVIEPTPIAKPIKWSTDGMSVWFTAEGEKGIFCVDLLMKSINRLDKAESKLKPVPYLVDVSKLDPKKCCGEGMLAK